MRISFLSACSSSSRERSGSSLYTVSGWKRSARWKRSVLNLDYDGNNKRVAKSACLYIHVCGGKTCLKTVHNFPRTFLHDSGETEAGA